MKKYKSRDLLDQLQSDVRGLLMVASQLRLEDPHLLMKQPAPGNWTVTQVLEHLNSYNRYYLPAIERSLQRQLPAPEYFTPGWMGDYFTKLMQPAKDGTISKKLKAPKNHRPPLDLDTTQVLNRFIQDQHRLLELLENAKMRDIGRIRTPISISRLIRLKVGDTFRFLIAHEQRHFLQLQRTLETVRNRVHITVENK
jgi:hypothetical protein